MYKSCIDKSGKKLGLNHLHSSYTQQLDKAKLNNILTNSSRCKAESVSCAEDHIVMANQLLFRAESNPSATGAEVFLKGAAASLDLAETILGDDILIYASKEKYNSVVHSSGHLRYILSNKIKPKGSIYQCKEVVSLYLKQKAARLGNSGDFIKSYYISRILVGS